MSNSLHEEIYKNMDLKETDELLEIWQSNDRVEWSDQAFEVIEEILANRSVDLPVQHAPVYEYEEGEDNSEDIELSDAERELVADENPPALYKPSDVLRLEKWLGWGIKALFVMIPAAKLIRFSFYRSIAQGYMASYEYGNPSVPVLIFLLTLALIALDSVIVITFYYLVLSCVARILKILMQMEFNSRRAGRTV